MVTLVILSAVVAIFLGIDNYALKKEVTRLREQIRRQNEQTTVQNEHTAQETVPVPDVQNKTDILNTVPQTEETVQPVGDDIASEISVENDVKTEGIVQQVCTAKPVKSETAAETAQPTEETMSPVRTENATSAQNIPQFVQNEIPPVQNAVPSASTPQQTYNNPYNMPYVQNTVPCQQTVYAQQTPQQQFVPKEVKQRDKKISTINIMLILGALFIIISGLIFATTTWDFLSSGVRAVVILSFAVVFFGISVFSEKKLKLPKTGILFYTLGSVFLPITLIASGYFKVFGEYLSLEGDGRSLLLAITAALLSAVCIFGSCNYKNKAFAWSGLVSFSTAVSFLSWQLTKDVAVFSLAVSIYSLVAVLLCEFAAKKESERFSAIISQLKAFAIMNTSILSICGIVTVFGGDNKVLAVISCIIFAGGYLRISLDEKTAVGGAVPFTLFAAVAVFCGLAPDDASEIAWGFAAVCLVPSVLSLMGIIPEKVRDVFDVISKICTGFSLIWCMFVAVLSEPDIITLVVFAIFTAEILLIGILRRNTNSGRMMYGMFSVACVMLAVMSSKLITAEMEEAVYGTCIVAVAVAALQTFFVFVTKTKLRTHLSDIVFTLTAVILEFDLMFSLGNGHELLILAANFIICGIVLMPSFGSVTVLEEGKEDRFVGVKRIIFPMISLVMAAHISAVVGRMFPDDAALEFVKLIPAAIVAVPTVLYIALGRNKSLKIALGVVSEFILFVYSIIIAFNADNANGVFTMLWFMSAVLVVKGIADNGKLSFGAGLVAGYFAFAETVRYAEEAVPIMLLICGASAVGYVISMAMPNENIFVKTTDTVSRYCLFAANIIHIIELNERGFSAGECVFAVLFILMTVTAFYNVRFTVPLVVTLSAGYGLAVEQLEWYLYENHTGEIGYAVPLMLIVLIVLSIAMSYILHRKKCFEAKGREVMLDAFAVARFFGFLVYVSNTNSTMEFFVWFRVWILGACVLSLWRTEGNSTVKRVILSLSALTPVIAWNTQPFIELPELFATEINMLPVILYCVLLRFIWKNKLNIIGIITFVVYIVLYVILFAEALDSGKIADGLFIVISSLAILVFSFCIKQRKWFILGIVILLTATLFMSKNFWASLEWWVYLLVAGLILIAIGMANEIKKQAAAKGDKTEFEKKLTRFMSEWTW